MIKLIKELLDHNKHNTLKYVFMVSGGVDSIAASHYLFKKIKDKTNSIFFHYNHNNRDQNNLMQSNVAKFAKDYSNLGSYYCRVCTKTGSKSEDECRSLRFDCIDNIFQNCLIITAHHLDDCAESYLLNCFRGKDAYKPMPLITHTKYNVVIHPFLLSTKKDFIEYASRNNLNQYIVEDETNYITKGSRRNMIRHKIIPILEQEQVGLRTIVKKKIISSIK